MNAIAITVFNFVVSLASGTGQLSLGMIDGCWVSRLCSITNKLDAKTTKARI